MASQGSGSIVLKLLILVAAAGLWAVLTIPPKIWNEENQIRESSRENMSMVHEAQRYYYKKTNRYVPGDSLEKLLGFLESDSSLKVRRKIGELSNSLYDQINNILAVPALQAILPISQSVFEISNDLRYNERSLKNHEGLSELEEPISVAMRRFKDSGDFPMFVKVKTYVDSLYDLRERLSDYELQTSAYFSQRYADSLAHSLGSIEKENLSSFWTDTYGKCKGFISAIKKTDLVKVSTLPDRLSKFSERINNSVNFITKSNMADDTQALRTHLSALARIRESFISQDNFLITKNRGSLKLSDSDSMLVKLTRDHFFDPDTYDGEQRYIIDYSEGSTNVTVESPNLSKEFTTSVRAYAAPLQNLSFYSGIDELSANLDSSINVMNTTKNQYKLNNFSNIILKMKEVGAELKDLDNVLGYRYMKNMRSFAGNIQTEDQISQIKAMVVEMSNPMDTLARRIENRDLRDVEKRMRYFSEQFGIIDSLIADAKIPAREKAQISSLKDQFDTVFGVIDGIKSSFQASDAKSLREAKPKIDEALDKVLNGYKESVYGVFSRKHEYHGFVNNFVKSWEEDKQKNSE